MKKINFNLDWQFKRAGSSEKPQTVNLPHDAMLYEKRDRKAPTAGACGYFPGGAYEYTKSFFIPEEEQKKAYILEFEGVYKNAKIYVAGHRGMVGSAIVRELERQGYTNIITRTHKELDLTRQDAVEAFFAEEKPEYVFLAAAKVGGIVANQSALADFMYGA